MSEIGSNLLNGNTIANTIVVGTIKIPTAIQLGFAIVNAASIPIWKLFPSNFLFNSSFTASANGILHHFWS